MTLTETFALVSFSLFSFADLRYPAGSGHRSISDGSHSVDDSRNAHSNWDYFAGVRMECLSKSIRMVRHTPVVLPTCLAGCYSLDTGIAKASLAEPIF